MSVPPSSYEVYLYHQGNLFHSYRMMGAHLIESDGVHGVRFTVWAPGAYKVQVAGDFNGWNGENHVMSRLPDSGIWWIFVAYIEEGTSYKFEIVTPHGDRFLRADPYAFRSELRPGTASIVHNYNQFDWTDHQWMNRNPEPSIYNSPMNIYEAHPGSWKTKPDGSYYSYEELAYDFLDYVIEMGYTHIELMPLAEHPYDRSWGYQITGYYSITSRYGTPEQFKFFVNRCHERGIGIILDWVPAHFVRDEHGLRRFDGSPLYEYADPRKADKPLWGTLTFDYGKPEVSGFLISNAIYLMEIYHIDGLRVDAVASMLDLNFDKPHDMWITNEDGSTDNHEALAFLRKLNETVFHYYPNALMIAEDSSDRPLVSAPTDIGGLGFNYKWNMGWMNDILRYMRIEPEHRGPHLNRLLFSFLYTYSENFILPLSHDEVVHGKRSLLNKMNGDMWRKFADLRLLLLFMYVHPGKKLLFMGSEFGQFDEWKDLEQLDWKLLAEYETHQKMHKYVRDLNHVYQHEPALWELDHDASGVLWIDANHTSQRVVCLVRKGKNADEFVLAVINFSAEVFQRYRVGVPKSGMYNEILNSDQAYYGGSDQINPYPIQSADVPWHGQPYSIEITVPPMGGTYFRRS
ncbi:MAG: 1,4-alpha-glucan branching protein GlgB [Paenibacillaceae bacterium]